ncbi:MAG: hypothetical protein SCALA701_07600 [Candidatus Scalindua sp.]|nr:MAG: hypothetical protein SCALA701_07600 [Candidatus Scalindua sp.]
MSTHDKKLLNYGEKNENLDKKLYYPFADNLYSASVRVVKDYCIPQNKFRS